MKPVLMSLPLDISLDEVMQSEDARILLYVQEYFHNRRGFLTYKEHKHWLAVECEERMNRCAQQIRELLVSKKNEIKGG